MHKLTRTLPEPPALTTARKKNIQDWGLFSSQDKRSVRNALLQMQNCLCAYCERQLHMTSNDEDEETWDGHIEHFRRKDTNFHPELVFIWENLFYSCSTRTTCGRHKDHYISDHSQYDLLIDPCKDNPEDYFVFDNQGKISIRNDLAPEQQNRAELTIAAFHLNDPKLIQNRKDNQKKYEWLKQYSKSDIVRYLDSITQQPFITGIYHYFGMRFVS